MTSLVDLSIFSVCVCVCVCVCACVCVCVCVWGGGGCPQWFVSYRALSYNNALGKTNLSVVWRSKVCLHSVQTKTKPNSQLSIKTKQWNFHISFLVSWVIPFLTNPIIPPIHQCDADIVLVQTNYEDDMAKNLNGNKAYYNITVTS